MNTLNVSNLLNTVLVSTTPGETPTTITVVGNVPGAYLAGAVPAATRQKTETYVKLSALPNEVREKVITALQIIKSYGGV